MHDLYQRAIVSIKARLKIRGTQNARVATLVRKDDSCICFRHRLTEEERSAVILEEALVAALAVDTTIVIAVGLNDRLKSPTDLVEKLARDVAKAVQEYRRTAHARPLIEKGVPSETALSVADLILTKREDVIAFINNVGDPTTELT